VLTTRYKYGTQRQKHNNKEKFEDKLLILAWTDISQFCGAAYFYASLVNVRGNYFDAALALAPAPAHTTKLKAYIFETNKS
jgi:hypothetical protein